jgi:hypothetical protein
VSTAAGALAALALITFAAIYTRVSKPVNMALTAAAVADRVPDNARELQARGDSVINGRVALQTSHSAHYASRSPQPDPRSGPQPASHTHLVPNRHSKENPMTATREVFDRHMSHQLDRDLDAILTDYAPDAIVVGPDGLIQIHTFYATTESPTADDRS